MRLLARFRKNRGATGLGTLEELERIARGLRRVPLVAPAVLFVGFGAGKVTNKLLGVSDDTPVRLVDGSMVPRGQLEAIARRMEHIRGAGEATVERAAFYREHIEPVERILRRRGVPEETARRVAWPLVHQTYENKLDVATVLSIVFIESNGRPNARSPVGARGLMQIMPFWVGYWRSCGKDFYQIEDNLCAGTRIFAYYLDRNKGDERRALLGYNGCVRGTTTPNCHTYPDKIQRLRRQIASELSSIRRDPPIGRAAAP